MKIFIIKKGHIYKIFSKDSYNRSKLMVNKWDDNNLLYTPKNHSQFKQCEVLKLWKFKVCTLENSKLQNFKSVLPHMNGV
jgi:hypothetical protein